MDAGDPDYGAQSPDTGDRALPGPSPSANLAGIWKGTEQKLRPPCSGRFLIFSFVMPPLKEQRCQSRVFLSEILLKQSRKKMNG